MKYKQVPVETKKISEARGEFNALVNEVYKEGKRVIIEKSGIRVAGIVSARDLERLKQLDDERAEFIGLLEKSQAAFSDVDPDELQREIDKAAAGVKAEMKAKRPKQLNAALIERADILEQMRAAFRDVEPDELQREIDKAVAEVKAEMRAERLKLEEDQRLATLAGTTAS